MQPEDWKAHAQRLQLRLGLIMSVVSPVSLHASALRQYQSLPNGPVILLGDYVINGDLLQNAPVLSVCDDVAATRCSVRRSTDESTACLYTGWTKNGPLLKMYNSCL